MPHLLQTLLMNHQEDITPITWITTDKIIPRESGASWLWKHNNRHATQSDPGQLWERSVELKAFQLSLASQAISYDLCFRGHQGQYQYSQNWIEKFDWEIRLDNNINWYDVHLRALE